MSGTHYSLTLDGRQMSVEWGELKELAQTGRLTPVNSVTTPSGSTIPAGDLPGLFGGSVAGIQYRVGGGYAPLADSTPDTSDRFTPNPAFARKSTPVWLFVVLVFAALSCSCCFIGFLVPGMMVSQFAGHFQSQSGSDEPGGPGPGVGKLAPTFTAADRSGKKIHFPADFKGKIVMLDFWATWCEPCMEEVPNLVQQHKVFQSQGFEILGVSLDDSGSIGGLSGVTSSHGMTWDQIVDGNGFDSFVAKLYAIDSIPSAFIVDGDTGLVIAEGDDIRGDGLAPAIQKALEERRTHPLQNKGGSGKLPEPPPKSGKTKATRS